MVPLLALSLQDQVEKYGAYIGIAAFFGLAALSLLYFAQARELKRLRDWAGRAPERAREVEERVSAQAEEARRAAAAPAVPTPAPAAAPAPVPQPIGAATAAGARSATVGPAVPVPAGPVATEEGEGEEGELPDAAPEPAASAPGRDGKPAAVLAMPGAPAEEEAAGVDEDEPEGAEEDAQAAEESGEDEPEGDGEGEDEGDGEGDGEGEDDLEPAAAEPTPAPSSPSNGAPAGPPRPAFPRPGTAAGAAAVSAAEPRPAAMPLRAGAPSATLPPRRSVTLPTRRPPPPPPLPPEPEHHSRTYVAAIAGVIAVVLAGGAFVATQLLGGDEPPAPNRAVSPTPSTPSRGESDSSDTSRPATRATTTVAVFNGTTITGLASGIADKVQAGGFRRGSTGNDTNQQRATSLVLYAREARAEGREVGKLLRISDVRPIDAETQALAGGNADVVVIVGLDQAP